MIIWARYSCTLHLFLYSVSFLDVPVYYLKVCLLDLHLTGACTDCDAVAWVDEEEEEESRCSKSVLGLSYSASGLGSEVFDT